MMPREHGSWAVLIAPIVVGFAAAGGAPAGVLAAFSAAALGGFLFRVPLQSLCSAKPAPRAKRWLVGTGLLAAAGAFPLLVVHGRWGLLGFAAPAALLLAYNLRANQQRETFSYANEVLGILGLCLGAPAAYYAARGTLAPEAWWSWGLSGVYFLGPVFDVKALALSHRASADRAALPALERQRRLSLVVHAGSLSAACAAVAAGSLPWPAALPFAASMVKTWRRSTRPARKIDFRRVGFAEVGYSVFFALAAGLGWALRLSGLL